MKEWLSGNNFYLFSLFFARTDHNWREINCLHKNTLIWENTFSFFEFIYNRSTSFFISHCTHLHFLWLYMTYCKKRQSSNNTTKITNYSYLKWHNALISFRTNIDVKQNFLSWKLSIYKWNRQKNSTKTSLAAVSTHSWKEMRYPLIVQQIIQ